MNADTIEALDQYLNTGCSTARDDVPDTLVDQGYVGCDERSQITCPEAFCEADAQAPNGIDEAGELTVVCDGASSHRNTVELRELLRCSLNPTAVLETLCDYLDVEMVSESTELPTHITAHTATDIDVCLITDPNQEQQTIEEVVQEATEHNRVVVLLSLKETVDHAFEILDQYAMALVRPYPFTSLEQSDILNRLVESATVSRDRKLGVRELYELDEDDLMVHLSENPGMVGEKLSHLITLRETGGATNNEIADQFEKTCRIAFMTLEGILLPNEGGGEDNFENVADTAFELPSGGRGFPEDHSNCYPGIFSVVDAKSGQKARLDNEDIITKHKRYLDRTQIPALEHHHITHVIVAHEITGAEDIRWYNRLKEAYKGNYTVVILTTHALYQLVQSLAIPLVRNELKLSGSDAVELVRPFFDSRVFERELNPAVQRILRQNPPKTKLPSEYDNYRQALTDCPDLLIVTEEMVNQHLEENLDSDIRKRRHQDYHQQKS